MNIQLFDLLTLLLDIINRSRTGCCSNSAAFRPMCVCVIVKPLHLCVKTKDAELISDGGEQKVEK